MIAGMNVSTRPATRADLDFARRAHHAAYRDVVVRQWGKWDEELQDSFFDRNWGDARFDVIMVDGVACGYTSVEDRADAVHLVELVLCPEHQSRGIGSTFLRSVVARAENEGKPARLRTCIENHRAQVFYRRHGFREIGRDETHLIMERTVQNAEGAG
jgi:GNAT superfamily N-acetyltransferase